MIQLAVSTAYQTNDLTLIIVAAALFACFAFIFFYFDRKIRSANVDFMIYMESVFAETEKQTKGGAKFQDASIATYGDMYLEGLTVSEAAKRLLIPAIETETRTKEGYSKAF